MDFWGGGPELGYRPDALEGLDDWGFGDWQMLHGPPLLSESFKKRKMIRDEELSDAFVEEELDRWERFLELSLEEAVLSTEGLQEVVDIAEALDNTDINTFRLSDEAKNRLLSIKDGSALFFAMLGRGFAQCTEVHLFTIGLSVRAREAIALCANLKSNAKIRKLEMQLGDVFGTPQICAVLSHALTTNNTLTHLCIRMSGLTPVALRCLLFGGKSRASWHPTKSENDLAVQVQTGSNDHEEISKLRNDIKTEIEKLESGGLCANVTLETLNVEENYLFDTTSVAVFFSRSPRLKSLSLAGCDLDFFSAKDIVDGLKRNTNLESLHLDRNYGIGYDGVKMIFELLSKTVSNIGTEPSTQLRNNTLKDLEIGSIYSSMSPASVVVAPLALMLETNNSLVRLCMTEMRFEVEHWTKQILPALSKNTTLEELDLTACDGLDGEDVFQALLKVLQDNNTRFRKINLSRTGMVALEGQVNEELRIKEEYRDRLSKQPMVTPTSGRLVLCGYEFAGKTTIRNTLERTARLGTPSDQLFKTDWKRLLKGIPCLYEILFGTDAPRELAERTRGFDILVIDSGPQRTCVWDFAGQREYYALHDYLFPDVKNSFFLYVSSCRCPPDNQNLIGKVKSKEKMKDEFLFWMRFIASNSTLRPHTGAESNGIQLPYVHFVLTNKDTLSWDQEDLSEQWAQNIVDDFKQKFQGVIELGESISTVNARSAGDVQQLMDTTNIKLQEMLSNPSEYAICKEVRSALEEWSAQNLSNPIMHMSDFQKLCEDNIRIRPAAEVAYRYAKLSDPEGQMAILAYLNDMGDIIYPKGFDFIVVNPRWFGTGVLGHLIDVVREAGSSNSPMTAFKRNGFFGHPKPSWKIDHDNGFVSRRSIRKLLGHSLKSLEMQDVVTGITDDMLMHLMIKLEMCFEEVPKSQDSRLFLPALFDDDTKGANMGERQLMWSVDNGTTHLGLRLQCKDKATTFLTPGFFPRLQVHLVNYLRQDPLNVDNSRTKVSQNLMEFTEDGMQVFVEYSGDIDYFIDILVKSAKSHAQTLQFIETHLVTKIRDFCASPQGCQGVILEEAIIRPLCVKKLLVCARRKGHSELVSTLERNIKAKGNGYVHHWERIGSDRCSDYAVDLLNGEGYYKSPSSSSITSGSGRGDDRHKSSTGEHLPQFYLSIKDVGMQSKLRASIKASKLLPFRLHLYCDDKEGSSFCKVEDQPGRDVMLACAGDGYNFSNLKPVIKFLWDNFGFGFSMDTWITEFFDVGNIPNIDKKTLQKWSNPGDTVSEDDLVKVLEDHIAYTGRLKKLLNVDDEDKFWKDFQLRKVIYANPSGKNGWLCEKHVASAVQQNLLKTNAMD